MGEAVSEKNFSMRHICLRIKDIQAAIKDISRSSLHRMPLVGVRRPPAQPRGNGGRRRDDDGPSLCHTPACRQSSRVAEYTLNLPISCLNNRDHRNLHHAATPMKPSRCIACLVRGLCNSSARAIRAISLFLLPFGAAAQTEAIELPVTHANDPAAVTAPIDSTETATAIDGTFASPRKFALPDNQRDFTLIRDGVPVTGRLTSSPSSSQGSISSPRSQELLPQRRNFIEEDDSTFCDIYTLGAGWREPMQLYLGEGSRKYLPQIKRASQAWNDLFVRDIIELKEDVVNYAYGPHPYENSSYYSDGVSVIYFHTQGRIPDYAVPRQRWNIQKEYYEMTEADIFILDSSRLLTARREVNVVLTLMHEIGHALGLGHITASGNIMSYDKIVFIPQTLGPFMALGFFPDYGTQPSFPDWEFLYGESRHSSLIQNLLRPQPQDIVALTCLYDFATWGQ